MVKVLSVPVTLHITDLSYQRRDLSGTHFQYGLAAAGRLGSRGFIDEEDLFVHDLDAFYSTLEARGPGIGSVFFIYL
jgi:hypothetical protein